MSFLHDLYGARGRAVVARKSTFFIPDKTDYISPLDRTVISGRTAHREHMKRNQVIEAGDMKLGEYSNRENAPMPSVRDDIKRSIQELS